VKYAWIDAHRNEFDLANLCDAPDVSVSGYRAWKRGGTPNRKCLTDAQLLALIRATLTMVWFRRKPAPGLIHHSDRGSQAPATRSRAS
jgi:hypothetical protein